jgi:hypothetical protein
VTKKSTIRAKWNTTLSGTINAQIDQNGVLFIRDFIDPIRAKWNSIHIRGFMSQIRAKWNSIHIRGFMDQIRANWNSIHIRDFMDQIRAK